MVARKLFICSAIDQCKETVNCCAHKQPHVKTEACIPRECRYAPGSEDVDCVPYPIEKPAEVPVLTNTVVHPIKGEILPEVTTITRVEGYVLTKHDDGLIPELIAESAIKAAVKKQAKRPAIRKKGGAS
jgi:hypothetical protein